MTPEIEDLVKKIGEQGDKVRELKSTGAVKVCYFNVVQSIVTSFCIMLRMFVHENASICLIS